MALDPESFNIQEQIRRYLGLARERWYAIAVCTIIAALIGFGIAKLWPVKYESSTLFVLRSAELIDDSSLERALTKMKLAAQQRTLFAEIRSQSRLAAVLNDLEWKEYITAQMDYKDSMKFMQKVRRNLRVGVETDPIGDNHVTITFAWNHPQKAADFCNQMRDKWIDLKIENYKQDYYDKLQLAEVVLREREQAYYKAKQELERFETETGFASLGSLEDNNRIKNDVVMVIDENQAIVMSQGTRITQLENELANLPRQVQTESKTRNPEYIKVEKAWKKKRDAYREKQKRWTDANPDLIKLKEDMENAKKLLDDMEDEEYVVEGLQGTLNPEYVNKSALLDQLRPEYEMAKEKLVLHQSRLESIEEKIKSIPGIYAERKSLQANIDLARNEYEKAHEEIQPLRDRVRSFSTVRQKGGQRTPESTLRKQAFEVLQRALPDYRPMNSMTMVILSFSLFIGFAIGLALSLLGELLKSSFSTQEEVLSYLRKPVLGAVNRIMTSSELRAIKWRKIIFTSSSLLVIFSLVALIYICNRYPHLIPTPIVKTVNEIRESMG